MKHICFIVDSIFSIGGVQRVTAVIAKELAKDYDVTIVTFDDPKTCNLQLYGLEESNIQYSFFKFPSISSLTKILCKIYGGIYIKLHLKSKWTSDLYAHSSFPSALRNALIKELRPKNFNVIIGVHAPLAARLATLRKQLPNTKLIGWLHNSFDALFGESSQYIGTERKRHYVFQFSKLDETIVLCKNDAFMFHQYDNQFQPSVIYNPLTLLPGGLSHGDSKTFLTIGRFTPLHKGIDLLIEAFHLFAKNNKEWKLVIVGEGPEKDTYKALIQKNKLENRIIVRPFTNNIQDYYSMAQVYVLSSRWEGMPLVLVEAMSHGLPIVTSDLPVCKEILGESGLYFKNGDVKELANRLEEATTINWPKKSQQALEIANRFDIHKIIDQWKSLIEG